MDRNTQPVSPEKEREQIKTASKTYLDGHSRYNFALPQGIYDLNMNMRMLGLFDRKTLHLVVTGNDGKLQYPRETLPKEEKGCQIIFRSLGARR